MEPREDTNAQRAEAHAAAGKNGDGERDWQEDRGVEAEAAAVGGEGDAARNATTLRAVLLAGTGNVLEWFDFGVFGFFAQEIGQLFFPGDNEDLKVLDAFAVFGGAFLVRPLGGLFFGWFGDRFGRKLALFLSMVLMSVSTFSMGCLPTYSAVGWVAPVLLSLSRLMQGFSVGGQLAGSFVYSVESAPRGQEAFYGSLQMVFATLGVGLGCLVAAILSAALSTEQLLAWGWRLPFLSGILVGPIAWIFRRSHEVKETLTQRTDPAEGQCHATFCRHGRSVTIVVLIAALWCSSFYIVFVWICTFAVVSEKLTRDVAYPLNTLALVWLACCMAFVGRVGKDWDPLKTMLLSSGCLIAVYPLVLLLLSGEGWACLMAQFLLAPLIGAYGGSLPVAMCRLFPPASRYLAVAAGYNIAQAIFGGSAPLLASAFWDMTNWPPIIGFYLMLLALICFGVLYYRDALLPMKSAADAHEEEISSLEIGCTTLSDGKRHVPSHSSSGEMSLLRSNGSGGYES